MCRFIAMHGYIDEASQDAFGIALESLVDAARVDKYSDFKSHDDGWGFSVFTDKNALLYKSIRPIWSDENGLRKLRQIFSSLNKRRASIVIHARKASSNTPREVLDAHPFMFRLADGNLFSFAHNGAFNLSILGYTSDNQMLSRSDSYIYAKEVLSKATYRDILQAIRKSIEAGMVKSAMNIAISIKTPTELATIAVNYYLSNKPLYYDMYYLKVNDLYMIGSSTNMEKTAEDLQEAKLEKLGNHGVMVCRETCSKCTVERIDYCHSVL